MKGGLKPLPKDNRDFSYQKVFGAVEKVPDIDFMVAEPVFIEDQKETDFCTGFAVSSVSEDQEGIDLCPLYAFAKIKQIEGNYESWGADLRSACKAMVKFGCIKKENSPFNLNDYSRDFIANWNNWTKVLDEFALEHKKESYFRVDEGKDIFESLRAVMWQNRAYKRSILTGVVWRANWNNVDEKGIIANFPGTPLFGHAIKIFGQKMINHEPYLIVQQSCGKNVGDNGLLYFPREIINRDFTYGAFMFTDMLPEEAKKLAWSCWRRILGTIKKLLKICQRKII